MTGQEGRRKEQREGCLKHMRDALVLVFTLTSMSSGSKFDCKYEYTLYCPRQSTMVSGASNVHRNHLAELPSLQLWTP